MLDIKKEFSIFENYKKEYKSDLIYLDSAASSLTPDLVVEKMNEYYFNYRSNIDRAISNIAQKATSRFDESRKILAKYLNCNDDEIIWTSGATAASNMLVDMISLHDDEYKFLNEGDEILTTIMEHHSSLLPFQALSQKKNLKLKFLELNPDFTLDISNLESLVNSKTRIVSICMTSNVLGAINNLKDIVEKIRKINNNIFVICDMTSAFGHTEIDLKSLREFIDAGYFSLHKAFGPTGVGVLWMKRELSRAMKPTIFGGGIVSHVEREKTEFRSDIKLFEAGTANIAGVIGAGEAVKFLQEINSKENILKHDQKLVNIFIKKISDINLANQNELEIKIFSNKSENNIGIVSFQTFVKGKEVHPHDVADIFNRYHIAVRAGHHCAEPLMNYLGVKNGLTRISFYIYNNESDISRVVEALSKVKEIFGK
ncbi:MAG: aminotransferase class V-fold PLP-dependent enzyme [Candidatus Nomurabacteria bacterium]